MLLGEFKTLKYAENHKIYKMKYMHNKIINRNNILKTWYENLVRPLYMHYNHCVSPYVHPICFPQIPFGTGYSLIYVHFSLTKICFLL